LRRHISKRKEVLIIQKKDVGCRKGCCAKKLFKREVRK